MKGYAEMTVLPLPPKKRVLALIRNFEYHLTTGAKVSAADAFAYMDLCALIHQYEAGLADDAMLEKKLAEFEGVKA